MRKKRSYYSRRKQSLRMKAHWANVKSETKLPVVIEGKDTTYMMYQNKLYQLVK